MLRPECGAVLEWRGAHQVLLCGEDPVRAFETRDHRDALGEQDNQGHTASDEGYSEGDSGSPD